MIKVTKTQGVLFILTMLLKNGFFTKSQIQSEIDISDLRFSRYMQEIRAFFANFYMGYDLVYSRKEDKYFLKNS